MNARALEIAGVVAGLAVLVIFAIAGSAGRGAGTSAYSTYDTRPNGYRALYETLRARGARVSRFEREIGEYHAPQSTLVVASNALESKEFSREALFDAADAKRLMSFVRGGGRLVILDGGESLQELGAGDGLREAKASIARDARGENVAASISAVYGWTSHPAATPLLFTRDGLAAIESPLGRGSLVVILAPNAFSNGQLLRGANVAFADRVLAGHGAIAFDEYVHGHSQVKTFWDALAAPVHASIWIALAIVALALVDGNVRFAPAIPLDPPDERDSSAYITSMAALLRRARAGHAVVERLAADVRSRMRARTRIHPAASARAAELERLVNVARPSDAVLLEAARAYSDLRKDF